MTPVETSALVAILLDEDDGEELFTAIVTASEPVTLVTNLIEAALSVGRHIRDYDRAEVLVRNFCDECGIRILPLTMDYFSPSVRAFRRYGKGSGHSARLNFGDCISYAMAKKFPLPMIYKGEDFARTDLG